MARPFLSIIVPTHNDTESLPITLIDIDRYLGTHNYSYEILVVDDASEDVTAEMVTKLSSMIRHIKFIGNPEHRGRGSVVKIGMLAAKGNWRLTLHVGNTVPLVEFNKFMSHISSKRTQDILIGSRHRDTNGFISRLFRRGMCVYDVVMNKVIRILFKSRVKDMLLDFHCFSEGSAEKIFSHTRISGPGYLPEAVILGEQMGFKVKEVAIGTDARQLCRKTQIYLQMFWETIKMRWWLNRKSYSFMKI